MSSPSSSQLMHRNGYDHANVLSADAMSRHQRAALLFSAGIESALLLLSRHSMVTTLRTPSLEIARFISSAGITSRCVLGVTLGAPDRGRRSPRENRYSLSTLRNDTGHLRGTTAYKALGESHMRFGTAPAGRDQMHEKMNPEASLGISRGASGPCGSS
jgi:hypothetical protein